MASPTTIQHGAAFALELDSQILASRQNGTLNLDFENADVSDADGGFWIDRLHTLKSWSVDAGAWYVNDEIKTNGQRFRIEIETVEDTWTELKCRTAQSLSLSMATIETTSTCTGDNFREYLPDKRSASISTTIMYSDYDDAARTALKKILDDSLDQLKVNVRFRDTVTDGVIFEGSYICTGLPLEYSYDQPTSVAITLESAGAVTRTSGTDLSSSLDSLLDAFFATPSTPLAVVVGSDVAEATIFTGNAYITQFDITADFDSPVQVSIALQGTGPLSPDNNPVS
jgi:predicted secreted protein